MEQMDLEGKHTVVFGLGKTGIALVRFLLGRGARVTVADSAPAERIEKGVAAMGRLPVDLRLGAHSAGIAEDADLVILSPGVPHTLECLEKAREKQVPVIGEIELAAAVIDVPVVAVTGTNGKTTTTRLVGCMLERSGKTVFVGGNLGKPLIDYANARDSGETGADVVVAEVSSFQLDTIVDFRPRVGVLLNITPDHLDRYPGFDSYARSKARLFMNQGPGDTAVLNAADPVTSRVTAHIKSRRCMFNQDRPGRCGAMISDSGITLHMPGTGGIEVEKARISITGRHNLENAAAAALAALAAGATLEGVLSALAGFVPDPHRLERVATIGQVSFYDDSKATNVDATVRAIEALSPGVVLIAGGKDKLGGYEALREPVARHVKSLVVMGESAEAIHSALCDLVETRHARSMPEAVQMAADMAGEGDKVLLSPACSSFDMYENYAARGEHFQACVRTLETMAR